jgi:hypothetical protein
MVVCPLAFPENQPTFIYGRLYLSIKNVTIIDGIEKKNYSTCSKHVSLTHLEEEEFELL